MALLPGSRSARTERSKTAYITAAVSLRSWVVVADSVTPFMFAMSESQQGTSAATFRGKHARINIDFACERALNETGGRSLPIHDGPRSALLARVG